MKKINRQVAICERCYELIEIQGKSCPWLDMDNDYCEEIFEINNLVNNLYKQKLAIE